MELLYIDASILKKAFIYGAKTIEAKKEWINELNVFPVPDGDTGTNMSMTIMSAAKEVMSLENPNMESLAKAISSGSLRGARGNSGVILSQLFRGFTKEIKDKEKIDTDILAKAFTRATETAYKAVMRPKEGTILTVARGISEKALEISEEVKDINKFFELIIEEGDIVLASTPEILPVLKQAGVVDSGGQGLMQVLKGMKKSIANQEDDDFSIEIEVKAKPSNLKEVSLSRKDIETADIKFGYCTEFIIVLDRESTEKDEDELKDYFETIGDSIVCVADEEYIKVHLHTNNPGNALQKGLSYGYLSKIKIDNMREEHEEVLIKDSLKLAKEQKEERESKKEQKEVAFLTVSVGEGLKEIFLGIGADYIIEGGQSMNPSTEDILKAIEKVNAKEIYILPNNKNIILAANQAASICEDKKVYVIETKTIPQGITAILNYAEDLSAKENLENIENEIKKVKTLSLTYAVRDTEVDGFKISNNDMMAIGDSSILAVSKNKNEAILDGLSKLIDENSELLSIYYGDEVSEEEANELLEEISKKFENIEIDLQYGGQAIYYYILSVE